MIQYEYRVVPAPRRGKRVRGLKTPQERFAAAVAEAINEEAAGGWEFWRSETLPMEERAGLLKGRVEVLQSLLVFRRPLKGALPEAPEAPDPARVAGAAILDQPRALREAPAPARPVPTLRPARETPEGDVPVIRLGTPRRDGDA